MGMGRQNQLILLRRGFHGGQDILRLFAGLIGKHSLLLHTGKQVVQRLLQHAVIAAVLRFRQIYGKFQLTDNTYVGSARARYMRLFLPRHAEGVFIAIFFPVAANHRFQPDKF